MVRSLLCFAHSSHLQLNDNHRSSQEHVRDYMRRVNTRLRGLALQVVIGVKTAV